MRVEWELKFWFAIHRHPQCICNVFINDDDGSYLFVCGGNVKGVHVVFFRRRTKGVGAYHATLNKQQLENVSIRTDGIVIFLTNELRRFVFTSFSPISFANMLIRLSTGL